MPRVVQNWSIEVDLKRPDRKPLRRFTVGANGEFDIMVLQRSNGRIVPGVDILGRIIGDELVLMVRDGTVENKEVFRRRTTR